MRVSGTRPMDLLAREQHLPDGPESLLSALAGTQASEGDISAPELSIVIPALNEQLTIDEFVSWCHEGLQKAGVRGEILIIDSSTDETPQRALAAGARVLKTPRRGLGRAYIDCHSLCAG